MSLPTVVTLSQNREIDECDIVAQAFGGEENVPSYDGVHVSLSYMTKSYSRSRLGLQIKFSPYRENDFRRAVKANRNGLLDAEKIRDKYKEVLEYGKEDVDYVERLQKQREEVRTKKQQLRDEVKEQFQGSKIFKPFNEDGEIFHYDHSFDEWFNRDVVNGEMKVTSTGVDVKLENLSVEETQQVVDLILEMRSK